MACICSRACGRVTPRAKTPVDREPVDVAQQLIGREDERLPELGLVAIEGAGAENADNLVRFAVQDRTGGCKMSGSPPK